MNWFLPPEMTSTPSPAAAGAGFARETVGVVDTGESEEIDVSSMDMTGETSGILDVNVA